MTETSPRNPLKGSGYVHLLLQELSDEEVAEYCDYWSWRREQFTSDGQGFAAWKASNLISAGHREAAWRRAETTSAPSVA